MFPLESIEFQKWLVNGIPELPTQDYKVSSTGSVPWLEEVFDDLLREAGIEVHFQEHADILIVGREDWTEESIEELLDDREGEFLKVYSQEMFLAHWVTGVDPFDDEVVAQAFVDGHPALEFLSSRWVEWKSCNVQRRSSQGANLHLDAPEIGVLKALGYTVGKTKGLEVSARREILAKVFSTNLNNILPKEYVRDCKKNYPDYLSEWGKPRSMERLIKLRDFLRTGAQQQERRENFEAATDYRGDLNWVRKKFYTGRFKFDWLHSR